MAIITSCYAAVVGNLAGWTYDNGSSGIGATLTAPSAGLLIADGEILPVPSRVLIWNESNPIWNGVYAISINSPTNIVILTRTNDYNRPTQISPGDLIPVDNGHLYGGYIFQQTQTVVAIGTSPIEFDAVPPVSYPLSMTLGGTGADLIPSLGELVVSTASKLALLATAASGILVTDTSGNPSISQTIPSATQTSIQITESQVTNLISDLNSKLNLSGGTMTGLLILSGDATNPLGAVTLEQLDGAVGSVTITGTANQIQVTGTSPNFVLSFPNVLHSLHNTLDDGSGNANITGNLSVTGNVTGTWQGSVVGMQYGGSGANLTPTANNLVYSTSSAMALLPTANNGILITSNTGVPSISSTLPTAVQNNITSVGIITSGTWQGTEIGAAYGGTGLGEPSPGYMLIGDSIAGTWAFLPGPGGEQVLGSDALGAAAWTTSLPGAVQSTITISESQVTNLTSDLNSKLNLAGGTMTGALILNADPTNALGAVTKQYADAISAGLDIKQACYAATAGSDLGYTYSNGSSGVGATLTAPSSGVFTLDGTTPPIGSRILVKNETTQAYNGIYSVTTSSSGAPAVLTRTTDFNTPSEIQPGNLIVVDNGTVNMGTGWLQTATVTTIGTSNITFSPFNLMQAGTGLTRTGNTISLSTPVSSTNGGTGVNNGLSTITLGGNLLTANSFTTSGNFAVNQTYTATTNVTFPTSGTLFSTAGIIPIANGGTGTATPALVAGSGVSITGSWPNQTITATGANLVAGTNIGISGNTISVINNPTFSGLLTASGGIQNTTNSSFDGNDGASFPIRLFSSVTTTKELFLGFDSTNNCGFIYAIQDSTAGLPIVIGNVVKTGSSTSPRNILDDGSGNATLKTFGGTGIPLTIDAATGFTSQIYFSSVGTQKAGIKWDSTNGFQFFASVLGQLLYQGSTTVPSIKSHNNTLDDGTGIQTINYSAANSGINLIQSTTGNASYFKFQAPNSPSNYLGYIGIVGTGLVTGDVGALWLGTDSTNNKSIYLSAGNSTTWGLKIASGAVVNTAHNTLDNGSGAMSVVSLALTNPLPITSGGSGTATPSLVAGTGVSISGSWPNQTITATGANLVAGTNISISGNTINVVNNPTFSGLITANGGFIANSNSSFDGNDGGSFPLRLFSSVTTNKELFLGYDSTNDCGLIFAVQDSIVGKPVIIGPIVKTGSSIGVRNILDDGSGNLETTGQIGASSNNILIKWDATNGTQVYDGHNSSIWLYQIGTTSGSLRTSKTFLDDGSGNFIGQTDNTFLTQDTSNARIGLVKKSGYLGGFGSAGSNTINFYNFPTLSAFTSSGISANNPNVIFSIASNGATNTPHNTLDDGNGGCSLGSNTSSPINIGTGSYSGTLTIGSSSNNPIISIFAGSGTLSLGNAGNGICNLATSSFSGTLNIGSSSLSAFNINVGGINNGISLTQSAVSGNSALTLIPNSTTSTYRTAIKFGFGTSAYWEMGTDSTATKTTDFYLYNGGTSTFGFKISNSGVLNTNGYTTNSYNIVAGTNNPGIFLMYCGTLTSSAILNLPSGQYVTAVLNSASSTQSITINAPSGYTFTGGSTSLNCSPGVAFQLYVCSPINLVSKILA